ncbi:hypothetical protein QZH41_010744, partial [Actinostola sp. cb2023]
DHELKVISDRITLVEKHFAALSKDILIYNTALEGLREKGSRLSTSLDAYAEQEFPSVRNSVQSMSECIATVQDYIGAELEQDLQKATLDSGRSRQTMVEQMVTFEKKKIEDIKKIFGDFFHGQLLFHAKALEIYTQAYQNLMVIDEGQDLEVVSINT